MRNRIDIQPRHAALIVCTLGYAGGWTWPLEGRP